MAISKPVFDVSFPFTAMTFTVIKSAHTEEFYLLGCDAV
jgi:hypothetical protein